MTVSGVKPSRSGADPAPQVAARRQHLLDLAQRHGALAVLAILVVTGSLVFENFRTLGNASTILIASAPPAIIALGMTLVILTGGIDLSVGSVFALGGVAAAYASQWGIAAALASAVLCGAAFGLVNGLLVARAGMAPFVVTLATLLGARGLMLWLSDEGSRTYLVDKGSWFAALGQNSLLGVGLPVYVAVALFVIGLVVLQRTHLGHAIYAIGGSEEAARLMGARVTSTKIAVYVTSGTLAGLAGALNAARLGSGVTIIGVGFELNAIAAVVIGGTLLTGGAGSLWGTIAGVPLLGVIQNLINQIGSVNSSYQQVVSGAFLVVVVVAQTRIARLRDVSRAPT